MSKLQLRGRAEISEDLALPGKRKDYRDASSFIGEGSYSGNVHTAFPETIDTKFAQRVTTNTGAETDTAAQERKVVGEDGRRATEGYDGVGCQVLPFGLQR